MDVAMATFSVEEIAEILSDEGIPQRTAAFSVEMQKRFRPSDTGNGQFIEREDWTRSVNHRPSALFIAVDDGDIDPKEIHPRRHAPVPRQILTTSDVA